MPFAASGFRYCHPTDWLGLVSLAAQFDYQAIQFFQQARLKVADRLTIHTRCTRSAADLLKRQSHSSAVKESIIQAVEDSHVSLSSLGYLGLVLVLSNALASIRPLAIYA